MKLLTLQIITNEMETESLFFVNHLKQIQTVPCGRNEITTSEGTYNIRFEEERKLDRENLGGGRHKLYNDVMSAIREQSKIS